MPRLLSGRVGRALLLGLAVSLGVSVLSRVGALAGWETRAVNTFLALRDRGSAPDLVIIPIDEAAFRELGTTILVSDAARALLGDRVTVRERGALPLKGKAEPMEVYEVIGLAGEAEVRDATARG